MSYGQMYTCQTNKIKGGLGRPYSPSTAKYINIT